ncbi:B-cell receptor CD22-like isoform 2-T2 [Odontesthes bonariensis]
MMFRGVFGFALCANQKKEEGNITSRLSFCLQLTADTQGAYLYRRLSLSPRQTRGAAMSLTAALSGFLVVLLSVSAVQGQSDWSVTYNRTSICAVKGSTVEISCTYTHPYGTYYKVIKSFWFREGDDKAPVDLRTDSDYTGRVQYLFTGKVCSLRITDLRESDSAQYKFRFITNQQVGSFTGSPGVFLSVSALQVQVIRSSEYKWGYYWAELKCHSSRLSDHRSYVWTKNEQIIRRGTSFPISTSFYPADRVSCAVKGYKECPSPSVYAPKLPSVSVSPSAEIEEGSSVTLTCSSDANPAAQYTWYKEKNNIKLLNKDSQLFFSSIQSSDSGQYYCSATNQLGWKRSGYRRIDVKYAPKLPSVSVSPSAEIKEGSSVTLTCSSDANPAAQYTWYKEDQTLHHGAGGSYRFTSISSEDKGIYYCKCENQHGWINSSSLFLNVQYAPKLPSVSVSPSAEIEEGSSVTLTCSSDANPAAQYTWYKEKNNIKLLNKDSQLFFSSIQSSDSGQYYCSATNQLGWKRSGYRRIDVKYAPKLPSVSVSPSAEIEEGSSVTLTCSSDADPAAQYTWYKEDQTLHQGAGGSYRFPSISSEDKGNYYCKCENQYGWINSSSLFLNVQYAPKLPSVSVSPSAEIEEGSSVTLTCSSDANPAAQYTWYKEEEESPKASGQNFTIADVRLEHSGNYSCEAQNTRGSQNSTVLLTVVPGAVQSTAAAVTAAVLLPLVFLSACLWIRTKRTSNGSSEPELRADGREQCVGGQGKPEEQDEPQYASVHFSNNQADPMYSNNRAAQPHRHSEEVTEYAVVRFHRVSPAPRAEETREDASVLYSTINKTR